MPLRKVGEYAFNTGPGGQTLNQELAPLDLSHADLISVDLVVTKADTDVADTLNVYLQDRRTGGTWNDRAALTTITGDLSPSVTAPEVYNANIQKFGTLSDDEEESELSGSAGASRLTAGTVRNGPFPGLYRVAGYDGPRASWRIQLVVVDADNDADFEGTVTVYADC